MMVTNSATDFDDAQLLMRGITPQLSPEEELRLFNEFVACRRRLKALERRRRSVDASELLDARRDAKAVRDRIITANLPLVLAMTRRSRAAGLPREDMISTGMVTLVNCVDKFDPARGYKFSTYFCRAIFNDLSRRKGLEYRHQSDRSHYCEAEHVDQGGTDDLDGLSDLRSVLTSNSAGLTRMESFVLRMRYGLGNCDESTLRDVGLIVGLTKERVRQIQNKALAKLRETMGAASHAHA